MSPHYAIATLKPSKFYVEMPTQSGLVYSGPFDTEAEAREEKAAHWATGENAAKYDKIVRWNSA